MQAQAATFGRRGAPAPARREIPLASELPPPPLAEEPPHVTVYEEPILAGRAHPGLAAIGRALGQKKREEEEAAKLLAEAAAGKVPWSRRAAFVAAVVAALIQAAIVAGAKDPQVEIIPGIAMALPKGANIAEIVALAGILRGIRIAAISLTIGHQLAEDFKSSGLFDYTMICGAIGAIAGVLFCFRLGADMAHIKLALLAGKGVIFTLIVSETGTAAAVGFIYRAIAGRRPPPGLDK